MAAFAVVFDPDALPSTVAGASFVMPDRLRNPGRVSLTNAAGVIWTLTRGGAAEVVAGNSSYDFTPGADDDCLSTLAFTGASLRNTQLTETDALPS